MVTGYLGVVALSDYHNYATTITYVPIVAQFTDTDQYHSDCVAVSLMPLIRGKTRSHQMNPVGDKFVTQVAPSMEGGGHQ